MSEEMMLPNHLRAFCNVEVKAVNKPSREVMHLISTAAVDRVGDVVEPGGVELENFLKNPVVVADHSYTIDRIVGRAVSIEVQKDGIYARTRFRDTKLGTEAMHLASEGLGGWSIGFRPVEYEAIKDEKGRTKGFRHKKWELLEYSIVAIPMNQEIVNNAVTRGLVSAENVPVFFTADTAKPVQETAPDGAKAERVGSRYHPALAALIERAHRRVIIAEAARKIDAAIRED